MSNSFDSGIRLFSFNINNNLPSSSSSAFNAIDKVNLAEMINGFVVEVVDSQLVFINIKNL